jgi:coenzyme F420-0:L-glutamate ligase/coenzyme F420-1:gamma-L-glutamate ligase
LKGAEMCIKLIGIKNIPLIKKGDNLADKILDALIEDGLKILNKDILVIAETVVSKSEGNIIDLDSLTVCKDAMKLSEQTGKDPRIVEAIIEESSEIIKVGPDFIISETNHGFVCANAGIDESNVEHGKAKPIPIDPDLSAENIRKQIEKSTEAQVAVIISDTQGRPFREGAVGVSIGISGIKPIWNRHGEKDLYDRELKTTEIAVADELAAAASIVMGQADEGLPVVIIRGIDYFEKLRDITANSKQIIRPKKFDVFRTT